LCLQKKNYMDEFVQYGKDQNPANWAHMAKYSGNKHMDPQHEKPNWVSCVIAHRKNEACW
jgi:hypothetical protein